MHPYYNTLYEFLNQHPPNYGYADAHSLLEHLWHSYTELNPISNGAIKSHFIALEPIFESLPFDYSNLLFTTVCSLCEEHERQAFLEGIRVGVMLTRELAK